MKRNCVAFDHILREISAAGIKNLEALEASEKLHLQFWMAVEEFVRYCSLSKTSVAADGAVRPGNAYKLDVLADMGLAEKDDVRMECVVKIISKLDLVLRQPLAKQRNYCYAICNNYINDLFRKQGRVQLLSLQETVRTTRRDRADACSYEDLVPDYTYNGAAMVERQETIQELTEQLHQKEEKTRTSVMEEINRLQKKPEQVLVYMAMNYLGMKPRTITAQLLAEGAQKTYARIMADVARKTGLEEEALWSQASGRSVSDEALRLQTEDSDLIAARISHLSNAAANKLRK